MATVLVVDDEEAILHVLTNTLRSLGHRVVAAESVAAAMRCIEEGPINVVLADLVMPEQSGMDLLRLIKHRWAGLPVIIMTGKPSVDAAIDALKGGATDFLTKPIDMGKLQAALEAVVHPDKRGLESTGSIASDEMDLIPGYQIKRIVGMGKSSVVYLADWTRDGKTQEVALKIMRDMGDSRFHSRKETTSRFSREAFVVSSIIHPNIVKIYDFDVTDDSRMPYIAMEYVPGSSLRDKLALVRQQPLAVKIDIIRQVGVALKVVHERGLIHRDVKPHNILLTDDFKVKLTDFSLVSVPQSDLTQALQIVGTPAYMAPEAFFSADMDLRADLFSLGVTAYEIFFSARPFSGSDERQLAENIQIARPLDPLLIDPKFPIDLRRVLAHLLRKMVDSRYQSAAELLRDIDAVIADRDLKNPEMEARDAHNLIEDWSHPAGPREGVVV